MTANDVVSGDKSMTDHDRVVAITRALKAADRAARDRCPLFRHQDALGLFFFLAAVAGVLAVSVCYLGGLIPWWLCVPVSAFFLSVVREIEHDLIHDLYFRSRSWAKHLMMLAVWPLLGNQPHPWYRRRMHLLHHRTSGQADDFEERLIGNGLPFGPLKLLAMVAPELALVFRQRELCRISFYRPWEFLLAVFPVGFFYYIAGYAWLAARVFGLFGMSEAVAPVLAILDPIAVLYVLPNFIRQASMQVLAVMLHYHGDVSNRLHETQIIDAWWTWPMQVMCWNFGVTHPIHHFLVSQPFYLRMMISRQALQIMRDYGVRKNDTVAVVRANRFAQDRRDPNATTPAASAQ